MLAGLSDTKPKSLDELLGPQLIAQLDRLDILSRKMLAGKLPGERRSKRRGRSVEFDDFRQYVPGDDLRHIDWNILGRLDKLFIKLFREEEDLALHIILDASPSMDVGNPSKLIYAARLAAALGYIGLVNQNRVSLATFGLPADDEPNHIRQLAPLRGRTNVRRLGNFVTDTLAASSRRTAAAPTRVPADDFLSAMRLLGKSAAGRGVVVLISDFLIPGEFHQGLSYITGSAAGTFDTLAIQTLTPGELDPAREAAAGLVGDLRLTDVETARGVEVTVSPASIAMYKAALSRHQQRLRDECSRRGIAHFLVPTDTPIDKLLINTLRRGGLLR
ncbi:MAG TPA: DUF58 domain-containing protein [Phycisphaerales bacterium]|nr:DUF58 domain-containing protein [Phycisphaerales bacterium]